MFERMGGGGRGNMTPSDGSLVVGQERKGGAEEPSSAPDPI